MMNYWKIFNSASNAAYVFVCICAIFFMTSCNSLNMRIVETNSQSEQQQVSVSAVALGRLLNYLSTTTENWSFEKVAAICGIDFYDKTTDATASWRNRSNLPFSSGSVFKGGVLAITTAVGEQYREKPLPPNCFVVINERFPLGVIQYAKLLKVSEAQLDGGDEYVETHYKGLRNLKVSTRISGNRVISVTFTNQSWEP